MFDHHLKEKKSSWIHRLRGGIFFTCIQMVSVFLLTGCSPVKEDVQLASEEEVLSWCQEAYGEAEVVGKEVSEDQITYTMKDTEKGFTYQVVSKVKAIVFDTVLGYEEGRYSDFKEAYYAYFLTSQRKALEEIQKSYGAVLSAVYPFELTAPDQALGKHAGEEVLALIEAYDTRNLFGDVSLQLVVNEEEAGSVSKENGYTTQEEEEISYMMDMAAQEMGVSREKITFLGWESTPREDLEGLNAGEIAHILGTDNDSRNTANVYHFRYKNKAYFITDIVLMTGGRKMRHFGDYPMGY